MFNDDFNLLFPIQKIDKEKRIVTGIATADNVDLEGDQISFDGSLEAFDSWVGNIREMHDPKTAVGKLVDYKPVSVMHKGKEYNGIEVSVYISKGAQSTWEKVKDGTLRGFSIGGHAIEKRKVYNQELQKSVNEVLKYYLGELSLVDNPCNPAGQFTMVKMASNGQLEYVELENDTPVNYCHEDRYTFTGDNNVCPKCAQPMTTIGYVESLDNAVITKVVSDYEIKKGLKMSEKVLQDNVDDASIANMDFTDDQKQSILKRLGNFIFEKDEEIVEKAAPIGNYASAPVVNVNITRETIAEVVEEKEVEEIAKAAPVVVEEITEATDEVAENGEEMELEKAVEAFAALLDDKLAKVKEEISADVDAKIEKSVAVVKEENDATLTEVKDELEKVASSGAIKKSVDDTEEEEVIEKSAPVESFWGGIFVSKEIANTLGYES